MTGHRAYRCALTVVFVAASVACARPAVAQWRVGSDSATRLTRFGRDMAYGTAEGLVYAGVNQASNSPPQWGSGWTGYGRRAASNLGEFWIQEGVTEGLAALMNRPLDYARCHCGSTTTRVAWALRGAVMDRTESGGYALAVPRITGAYVGAFAQASWWPAEQNRARDALINGTTSLAIGVAINLYHEFRPRRR